MAAENRDMVQGTLEMLVMKTLALESMHGLRHRFADRADQQ